MSEESSMQEMNKKTAGENPTLAALAREEEIVWINPDKIPAAQAIAACELGMKDVDEAESRLARFACCGRHFHRTKCLRCI